ncbi:MAG: UDP-N-acetylmuramoyl-L-alanine--D-glutamate ligase [bacterium]|nr:UDP-N-acetylmuramoyl-L-alanine--D-glutamate ligase [bacterium]
MKLAQLEHKTILIVGYGMEGKATKSFLEKYVPSSRITVTDASNGKDYLAHQANYDIVIKTPGIPPRDLSVPYTTATNIFFANLPTRVQTIGVTGSKGKSTTASLIYHILASSGKKTKLVGNIGSPMLDSLKLDDTETIYVIELSSYMLTDIKFSPHISVITSLFPEHIPYHKTVEEYYVAKQNIVAHATPNDYYIYNPAYPQLADWAKGTSAISTPYKTGIPETTSKLIGAHNKDNIAAAYSACSLLNISDANFTFAVSTFEPLPHRLQTVGTVHGITFIDDAISTTPESTMAALEAVDNVQTIFLGGEDRGYDFSQLINMLYDKHIQHIVVFPDSGNRIAEELHIKHPDILTIYHAQDMNSAVDYAFKHTSEGSICLLSCASPSYSLWKNFQEKGDQFKKCIQAHETNKKTG